MITAAVVRRLAGALRQGWAPQTLRFDSWRGRDGATLVFAVAAPRRGGPAAARFIDADGDETGMMQRRFGEMVTRHTRTVVEHVSVAYPYRHGRTSGYAADSTAG